MSEVETTLAEVLASRLDRHLSERDFEQGCRLACGYDGDDRSEHIAADLAAVLAPVVAAEVERAVEAAAATLEDVSVSGLAARFYGDADGIVRATLPAPDTGPGTGDAGVGEGDDA